MAILSIFFAAILQSDKVKSTNQKLKYMSDKYNEWQLKPEL